MPGLGLANPQSVVDSAISATRLGSMSRNAKVITLEDEWALSQEQVDAGKEKFYQLAEALNCTDGLLPLTHAMDVLNSLNIFVDEVTMNDIRGQLEDKGVKSISFADITEIALFLLQQAFMASQQLSESKMNDEYYESPVLHEYKK